MRAPAIHIAMPTGIANMRRSFEGRGRVKRQPEAVTQFKFTAHDGKELKRPAIQGLACRYNKGFFVNGMLRAVLPLGFMATNRDTAPKRLLFDHNHAHVYGATSSGLEFATCPEGLAFRMPISDDADGRAIYATVMSGERPCVSIGGESKKFEMRRLPDGTEYQLISECAVEEISLVEQGAVADTFVAVVDLDEVNPWLWSEARSPGFATAKTVANINARGDRIAKALKSA